MFERENDLKEGRSAESTNLSGLKVEGLNPGPALNFSLMKSLLKTTCHFSFHFAHLFM